MGFENLHSDPNERARARWKDSEFKRLDLYRESIRNSEQHKLKMDELQKSGEVDKEKTEKPHITICGNRFSEGDCFDFVTMSHTNDKSSFGKEVARSSYIVEKRSGELIAVCTGGTYGSGGIMKNGSGSERGVNIYRYTDGSCELVRFV